MFKSFLFGSFAFLLAFSCHADDSVSNYVKRLVAADEKCTNAGTQAERMARDMMGRCGSDKRCVENTDTQSAYDTYRVKEICSNFQDVANKVYPILEKHRKSLTDMDMMDIRGISDRINVDNPALKIARKLEGKQ